MKVFTLADFKSGWLVGMFEPSVLNTELFEFGVKHFREGEIEPDHYQLSSWELSVVVVGRCRIGSTILESGEAMLIEPREVAGFQAISNCSIAVLKWPSIPGDKVLA